MDNHICIKIDKCVIDVSETSWLGCMVSGSGVRMDPEKARAIVDWPWPTSSKQVEQFLGLWNFYWRFIHNYSAIVSPITDLLQQQMKIDRGEDQEAAFFKIRTLFTSSKTLIVRHYDPDRPVLLESDASQFAIAAIVSQKFEDGNIHHLRYVSRNLIPAVLNYAVDDEEMLGVVFPLRINWHYLQGAEHKTIIFSDHQNLMYLKSAIWLDRWHARSEEKLQ